MKRVVMQILRSLVTVIVVGMMALMIFSLRRQLAAAIAELTAAKSELSVAQSELTATKSELEKVKSSPERQRMGVLEAIMRRASCRKFSADRPVDEEIIELILRCAMSAPTAMDKRPWEFVVVRDRAKLDALAEKLPYSRVGNGAPVAIIVCGSLDNGLPGRGKEYWIQDCSAASMNLLLAAEVFDLGAVWTGVYPDEERIAAVREIVQIPDGYAPLNVIPLGYPQEVRISKNKWNPAKIHHDQW